LSYKIYGNTSGLAVSELKQAERIYRRSLDAKQVVSQELAREILDVAHNLHRRVGVLVDRRGQVTHVILGRQDILYLPPLPKVSAQRLRGLRLIFSDLSKSAQAEIPTDILGDLEKLRLDLVVGVKQSANQILTRYAWLEIDREARIVPALSEVTRVANLKIDLVELLQESEGQIARELASRSRDSRLRAFLIGVYPQRSQSAVESMSELRELARTAGVHVVGEFTQYRQPDPRSLLGRGKLEQVLLEAIRFDADILCFDCELRPGQWRVITNATEMKVIDRSMLILDIFAQRAQSSDGRSQVELAQLKYNLPRLVEFDAGLSRLTGGIGGRGPGETKLELSRRRIRDRITRLERQIEDYKNRRDLRTQKRFENKVPTVALIGYTNAGKSSLFNRLCNVESLAEDKLFATLDTLSRRLRLDDGSEYVLTDTVGFIRFLPKELFNAFRATLEEIGKADLLLHILDASDPALDTRKSAVEGIIAELGFADIPRCNVLSKIDLVSADTLPGLIELHEAQAVSAKTGVGVSDLRRYIVQLLSQPAAPTEEREHDDSESY
jgi:GTP-binding protein HflX